MSTKIMELAKRVHRNVEVALWATLLAFVIYTMIFVLPRIPEINALNASIRAQEISAENARLCEKLSIERGTDRYNRCLLDVGEFRHTVEKRAHDDLDW
jgi:hypothetical protein